MSTKPNQSKSTEDASKDERAESVSRQLSGADAPKEVVQPTGDTSGPPGEMPPDDVGTSTTTHGEKMVDRDGKEAGRKDTGTDNTPAQRPTGTSTARDTTGVDPQEPKR
ncbi:MAG: hypothetical protein ABJD24_02095 [Acidimicrobiales bacterium]